MEFVSGNIFIRPIEFPEGKGQIIPGHTHNFDHTTYIRRGGIRIEALRVVKESTLSEDGLTGSPAVYEVVKYIDKYAADGNNHVLIKADVIHRLMALTDDAAGHCIYSHHTPQGDVVQEYDGWTPSYV